MARMMNEDRSFAALAAAGCPAYDAMLIALEREFHGVDGGSVADALDELARPLFGLPGAPPEEQATALAEAAWDALPQHGEAASEWLFGTALERGRAAGALRAGIAVELGRRAGVAAWPVRLRRSWVIYLRDEGAQLAADVGAASRHEPADVGPHCLCAHQHAFVVLTALTSAWRAAGDPARAQRASAMRLLLPLDEPLRSRVLAEVRSHRAAAREHAPD
jgi:hypothetical protein